MSILHAIVLGVVQGLTEFLPISSTGHLRIVPAFLGWGDPGAAFTAVVQLGTMAAVLIYFREDLLRITRATLTSLREPERRGDFSAREGWYIVLGTIPIVIFGFLLRHQIDHGARDLYVIGSALVVFSFVMLAAERYGTQTRRLEAIDRRDGAFIGVAQAIALVPGVSRSGATISAGLFRGFDRAAAARYSFLLSVPAVLLSGLFEFAQVVTGHTKNHTGAGALIVAVVLAFVVGYASIAFLLRYLTTHSIGVFVGYRLALGVLVLALTAGGAIS